MGQLVVPDIECMERWLTLMDSDSESAKSLVRARHALESAPPEVEATILASANEVVDKLNVLDAPWASPTGLGLEQGPAGVMADALVVLTSLPSPAPSWSCPAGSLKSGSPASAAPPG